MAAPTSPGWTSPLRALADRAVEAPRHGLRWALGQARAARSLLRNVGYSYFCPVCGTPLRELHPHGTPSRPNARCGVCNSLERHRLFWVFLQQQTDLFDGRPKTMLHTAPEVFLRSRLERVDGLGYVTVDLEPGRAMFEVDLTSIPFPDDSFDVILSSHVLEHIPDDRAAMAELRRVLKPSGWALLDVPISGESTYEDDTITDPDERARHFGQWDHVRLYGRDFAERLRDAGFDVTIHYPTETLGESACRWMGLMSGQCIHIARKGSETEN